MAEYSDKVLAEETADEGNGQAEHVHDAGCRHGHGKKVKAKPIIEEIQE